MSFENLCLHPQILSALEEAGYSEPTEIQQTAIPAMLTEQDLRATAQTGTGKTAAFLLPALHQLTTPAKTEGKGPRVLILVPTRELAMQVTKQAEKYSKHMHKVKTVCVYGGEPYHKQSRMLQKPYDILIATPGRLIDFIERKKADLSRIELFVLDEADRMLDMGFIEPVQTIANKTPSDRQTVMFSATLEGSVKKLSQRLLNDPQEIVVHATQSRNENIDQKLHYVDDVRHKNRLLEHILEQDGVNHTIIFTATKRHADQLVRTLQENGHKAAALHGDMNQRQRTRTLGQMRRGKVKVLVATDVAARGIDVTSITHVINFDLPRNIEDYVHRIGRTGRAGASGTALSFAAGQDRTLVKRIEKYTGHKINVVEIAGLEPKAEPKSAPKSKRRSFSRNRPERRFPPKKGAGRKRSNFSGRRSSSR